MVQMRTRKFAFEIYWPLVCSAIVPYCQIKKDYDDVVSPIFGPPGIQGDTKWVLHCVNSQRAVFKHCLFAAGTKIFTINNVKTKWSEL